MTSRSSRFLLSGFLVVLSSLVWPYGATAQVGTVDAEQKISEIAGSFGGSLDPDDNFGQGVAALGDLDGDGVTELAVCAHRDDDGGTDQGAVWILFLNPDGTVDSEQKISESHGGFAGALDANDAFGTCVSALGDLDNDGVPDLAVGARYDDDGGTNKGAIWILFLNPDGTVSSHQKISESQGGFGGVLDPFDYFGSAVATLGDLNADGVTDLAVGAWYDDDGGTDQGAIWILFLNSDGTVASEQKISETQGGFGGILDPMDFFGIEIASLGDLDRDGVTDIAVGAWLDDDGGVDQGAVWIIFLNTDGTVASEQKIAEAQGGFGGILDPGDTFSEVGSLGDLDGDGIPDIAVGTPGDDDGGTDKGAVWILFLNSDGTVGSEQKVSETTGGFAGTLDPFDFFGTRVGSLGDLDGDGTTDLAVGAKFDDDGGTDQGAVWVLFLHGDFYTKYCTANANSTGAPADLSASGSASSGAGDLVLTSMPVPNQNGIFFHGANQSQTPFGNGFLCATGDLTRGAVVLAAGNSAVYTYDNSDAKHSLAAFTGTTRHFQHWFRDPMGGGAFFNTSNAVSIAILQ